MDINRIKCSDIEEDQVLQWLKEPNKPTVYYQEPKLQEFTVEIIKLLCDVLQQTDEVFITSVEILEKYVHAKNLYITDKCNSLTVIACGILMSSKLIGSYPEIKISSLQHIMSRLSKDEVEKAVIQKIELDMLLTLGKLPLTTTITDLTMFLEYYIKNLKLRIDIKPLCMEILNVVYISKKSLFHTIKSIYKQSAEALRVFKQLICNKFYFPGGIVLCALKSTKLKNFLDLKQIVEDISTLANIHHDHLDLLADEICTLTDN